MRLEATSSLMRILTVYKKVIMCVCVLMQDVASSLMRILTVYKKVIMCF